MPVIEITDLVKRYGDRPAVDGVTLAVEEGEVLALLGANGAGKTTTVECVAGLRTPDGGSVRVLGIDPARDRATLTRALGIQTQASRFDDNLTVREVLAMFAACYPSPADTGQLIEAFGLRDQARTRFGRLSGGQQQRLSVAVALVGDPRIAILDELTTGLDPRARRETWGLVEDLRARGVTVVLVTHLMEEAERLADRVAVMDAGRIVAVGTVDQLVAQATHGQRTTFRAPRGGPADLDAALHALDGVRDVSRDGEDLVVVGDDRSAQAVLVHLARAGVVPDRLRVGSASLDDAYLALTGRAAAEVGEAPATVEGRPVPAVTTEER